MKAPIEHTFQICRKVGCDEIATERFGPRRLPVCRDHATRYLGSLDPITRCDFAIRAERQPDDAWYARSGGGRPATAVSRDPSVAAAIAALPMAKDDVENGKGEDGRGPISEWERRLLAMG